MREMLRDSAGKRRQCPFKGLNDAHHVSYKRFRRWLVQRSSGEDPAVSTPLATERQCEPHYELDTVCQRLELDSPPRHREAAQRERDYQETVWHRDMSHCGTVTSSNMPHSVSARRWHSTEKASEQGWVWRAAVQKYDSIRQTSTAGFDDTRCHMQPFAAVSLQGNAVKKLAAPSLLNDFYTNVLDCSCNGMIAIALGYSVYIWNSETRHLVGHLDPCAQTGQPYSQSISSLCWSRDGGALCIGTRRGELQLWDVEKKQIMRCLPSHLSVVRALSWKQHLLSSGCALGRIHHLDPRAPATLAGAVVQKDAICSLQWSPGDDWLASGSADGLLHVWDNDVAGFMRLKEPVTVMKQPTAVKAMGWCPWQRKMIATGGGWKDGELRIWDTQSATCVTSANTNSQICSLRWIERKKYLVTGHGLPHHRITCWTWEFPSLSPVYQLTGHSHRVLHLALNPESAQIFSAGADECFHIWDL